MKANNNPMAHGDALPRGGGRTAHEAVFRRSRDQGPIRRSSGKGIV
jgi:hypothetical protein